MRLALLAAVATIAAAACEARAAGLELRDGDRIVFVGGTLIEREQKYGYWETWLTSRHPELNLTFRNLGWSGDTVWGEARAEFGTREDGFKALVAQVKACQPTLIVLAYGANESFAGEVGLEPFKQQLNRLLDELSVTGARVAFILPPPIWTVSSRFGEHQDSLARYVAVLKDVAVTRQAAIVDLFREFFHTMRGRKPPLAHWYDGTGQLSELGYIVGTPCLTEPDMGRLITSPDPRELFDEFERLEPLRQAIIKKNELYFHRYRPQNTTYLFGFRKHEQGNNAAEIPEFDALVAEQEKRIAELLRPKTDR